MDIHNPNAFTLLIIRRRCEKGLPQAQSESDKRYKAENRRSDTCKSQKPDGIGEII